MRNAGLMPVPAFVAKNSSQRFTFLALPTLTLTPILRVRRSYFFRALPPLLELLEEELELLADEPPEPELEWE